MDLDKCKAVDLLEVPKESPRSPYSTSGQVQR